MVEWNATSESQVALGTARDTKRACSPRACAARWVRDCTVASSMQFGKSNTSVHPKSRAMTSHPLIINNGSYISSSQLNGHSSHGQRQHAKEEAAEAAEAADQAARREGASLVPGSANQRMPAVCEWWFAGWDKDHDGTVDFNEMEGTLLHKLIASDANNAVDGWQIGEILQYVTEEVLRKGKDVRLSCLVVGREREVAGGWLDHQDAAPALEARRARGVTGQAALQQPRPGRKRKDRLE